MSGSGISKPLQLRKPICCSQSNIYACYRPEAPVRISGTHISDVLLPGSYIKRPYGEGSRRINLTD